jgi:Xaa-Pro aminopeptidase
LEGSGLRSDNEKLKVRAGKTDSELNKMKRAAQLDEK